jgi:hypothetical protein
MQLTASNVHVSIPGLGAKLLLTACLLTQPLQRSVAQDLSHRLLRYERNKD